jgi:hypothetical protein
MVMPGDNIELEVKLLNTIAMEKGLRFAIREGGRTVGAGQVTEICSPFEFWDGWSSRGFPKGLEALVLRV